MDMGASDRRHQTVRSMTTALEQNRKMLNEGLDQDKPIIARRQLGQFSTPFTLATDIASFGLKFLENSQFISFLDPAFGMGVFYSALLGVNCKMPIIKAKGIEIDEHYGLPSRSFWSQHDVELLLGDFTKIEPEAKFNLIICNPPYVRHHNIESNEKKRLIERTERISGERLSGLAGLYCHFMLQSFAWLADGGIAGWLVPSEFLDVNYGIAVKRFLLSKVELLHIHRFSHKDLQFNDALVSSAVVLFRKAIPNHGSKVIFSFGGQLSSPESLTSVCRNELREEQKWSNIPLVDDVNPQPNVLRLCDFFTVKRGIATGNNKFFIIDEDTMQRHGLPHEMFIPILPAARHLDQDEVLSDTKGDPVLMKRHYLLYCNLHEEEIAKKYPELWKYLEIGRKTVASGYLCRTRKLWYQQEHRAAPIFACTYMGRKSNKRNTFRFILNHSNATVANTYLALYPKPALEAAFRQEPALIKAVWEILKGIDPQSMACEGRAYGGGLWKIEPKELLNVPVPQMADLGLPYMEMPGAWSQQSFQA